MQKRFGSSGNPWRGGVHGRLKTRKPDPIGIPLGASGNLGMQLVFRSGDLLRSLRLVRSAR